jgi:hypothetical protein
LYYVKFWERKKHNFEKDIEESDSNVIKNELRKEVEKCEEIIRDLPKFLDFIKTSKCVDFETLDVGGYKVLLNYIV